MIRLARGPALLLLGAALASPASGDPESPPRVTKLLGEIRAQQARLERRERELEVRERDVAELEQRVGELLAELEQLRDTVEQRIAAWEEESGDTVRRLAKIYAAMPPPRAALLMEELDVELATQIVAKMKHKESAAVLALLPSERAVAMSRQVAHPLRGHPAKPAPEKGR